MTNKEFYALSPRTFAALLKHHRRQDDRRLEHLEFMFGQAIAMIANAGFRSPEKALQAKDFMPSQWQAKASTKSPRQRPKPIRMTAKQRQRVADQISVSFPRY